MASDYDTIMEALKSAGLDRLEALSREVKGFPDGVDSFIRRRWIRNAIDCGSKQAVEWMLRKGLDLNFRDEEGYTPLLCAIERETEDRYEVLELLLAAGAPVNSKGINDWTPAHMAAARDDIKALDILIRHGADLSIRTEIDDYATPLEEARHLGKVNIVRYLERRLISPGPDGADKGGARIE
ncbi:MAG TPA: ankyrin repeat domain-containing protein [Elusimicrobiota bacterium]|nr:ankyrin repeat domain-containing protein [Elusimicrobiota bacterium]